MGYAFISYSTKDQDKVRLLNRVLSDNSINTWIAPDNIPAGENYAACLNKAIKGCSCFILLLSNNSQNSNHVAREVQIAVSNNKTIITLKFEELELNDTFEYYISCTQIVKIENFDSSDKEFKKVLDRILSFTGFNHLKATNKPNTIKTLDETKKLLDFGSNKSTPIFLENDEQYYCLGKDHLLGNNLSGTKQDFKSAFSYFSKAADKNNHPCAQYCLGVCYDHGLGVDPDTAKAKEWYELSAAQNNAAALYKLGLYYEYTNPDIEKALIFYRLAAEKDFSFAQCALGSCYYSGSGVLIDYYEAAKYFSLAAKQNNADAQAWLGLLFFSGNGFDADISKAKHWYTLAANQNHPLAQYVLGTFYYDGKGVKQDFEEAFRLFSLSASQGNVSACSKLSECYRWGYGVGKNENLANMWMNFYKSPKGQEARRKEILNKEFEIIRGLPIKNTNT